MVTFICSEEAHMECDVSRVLYCSGFLSEKSSGGRRQLISERKNKKKISTPHLSSNRLPLELSCPDISCSDLVVI